MFICTKVDARSQKYTECDEQLVSADQCTTNVTRSRFGWGNGQSTTMLGISLSQTLIHWDEQAKGANSETSYPPSHHDLIPVMFGGDLHNEANEENPTPKGD
jgi:hypothetical protein